MPEVRYLSAAAAPGGRADVSFMGTVGLGPVRAFHQSIPQYRVTPLRVLRELATDLGVGAVLLKDEAPRFGLGAFKGLGGVWAMARLLADRLGADPGIGFPELRHLVGKQIGGELTFVTATAANHGRGVAWAARQFGCKAVVFVPVGTAAAAIEAIRAQGAVVEERGDGFDEVVGIARDHAAENGQLLLQDTAWEGYETVPRWVLQGYGTMVLEALEQVAAEGFDAPTHVFLQVGVGSLAAAVTACLAATHPGRMPAVFSAEPTGAAALYASVQAKHLTRLDRCSPTSMSCLACTETSPQAWPVLRDWMAGHFACADSITELGQLTLKEPLGTDPRVVSGPSGALGSGLAVALCRNHELQDLRHRLRLGPEARVLLFSTEGTPQNL